MSSLVEDYDTGHTIGGELVTGAALAEEFDDTRIIQILAAGFCVFLIALFVSNSPSRAVRIAVGTIAVGAAVDGFASIIGERGVSTAPAVLLGMGFAADYLSHASAGHRETKSDNFARWGAAINFDICVTNIRSIPPCETNWAASNNQYPTLRRISNYSQRSRNIG